jgi:diphosphomevalonate decarboxylase
VTSILSEATARANSNIAFIKYWGNRHNTLRLPANSSLSMNLAGLYTETSVRWDDSLASDVLHFNNEVYSSGPVLDRVSNHLDQLRKRLKINQCASVRSFNTFPTGAGIASSASAFAALTAAAVHAANKEISERELTTLARLGSGSASRSIPDGHVIWYTADTHEDSFAETVADVNHWDIVDVIAIVSDEHKSVTSKTWTRIGADE